MYTNGIFPKGITNSQWKTLATDLNKIRFSVDSTDRNEWSYYKGRPPMWFDMLLENISRLVQLRNNLGSSSRIGASCLVSTFTLNKILSFIVQAKSAGIDFCDIKEVAVSSQEKERFRPNEQGLRRTIEEALQRIESKEYAPLDIVFDDSLLEAEFTNQQKDTSSDRCWVAITGRLTSIGPQGEIGPCCDADNPGFQKEIRHPMRLGIITDFRDPHRLRSQFEASWSDSNTKRWTISRRNCPYCVPSNYNYNLTVGKLFQDWNFGISLADQPLVGTIDHYLSARGVKISVPAGGGPPSLSVIANPCLTAKQAT